MTALAFQDRLPRAQRDQREPEDMKERSRAARFEQGVLAAARALLYPRTGSIVVAHDLARSKKDDHNNSDRVGDLGEGYALSQALSPFFG